MGRKKANKKIRKTGVNQVERIVSRFGSQPFRSRVNNSWERTRNLALGGEEKGWGGKERRWERTKVGFEVWCGLKGSGCVSEEKFSSEVAYEYEFSSECMNLWMYEFSSEGAYEFAHFVNNGCICPSLSGCRVTVNPFLMAHGRLVYESIRSSILFPHSFDQWPCRPSSPTHL